MSYADVAAKGPKQSPEEVSFTRRMKGWSSRSKKEKKDKKDKKKLTGSQARAPSQPEIQRSDDSVSSLVDVDSPHVSSVPSDFESQSVKTDTQAERIEFEREAKEARNSARAAKDRARERAKKSADLAKDNATNPVVLGNAVTVGILGTVLGVGAYKKYVRDELTWKVVGAWAGVVGLFAVGDYYVSRYLFEKYPPKK